MPSARLLNVVYTDGCCINNGKNGAVSGIGVYWHEGSSFNVSERLPGKQTNNRAEIHAAIRALEQCISLNKSSITIRTDSQFMIDCMTKWIGKWKSNGWRLSTGEPVKNRSDLEELDRLCYQVDVAWQHVPGHSGDFGNEKADQLAREGARL
ncbi:hypothetical protein GJ496_003080 [Pomphorhynchus laevis]|nr:hypothetical protein GJ496_003080 [Pomphorhynchus laevis]